MKTCCPHCDSYLTLTEEQLNLRQGMVRCGVCRQVFNALDHMIEDDYPVLLQEADFDDPVLVPSHETIEHNQVSIGSRPLANQSSAQAQRYVSSPVPSPVTSSIASSGQEPSFGQPRLANYETEPVISAHTGSSHSANAPAAVHIHLNQHPQAHSSRESFERNRLNASLMRDHGSPSEPSHRIEHQEFDDDDNYYIEQTSARRAEHDTEFSINSDSSYEDDYREYITRRSGGLFWFVLALIALMLFVGQFAYVFRNQISTLLPSSRPFLIQMCGFLKCDVGFSKSIDDLQLSQVKLSIDSSLKPKAGEQGLRLQAYLKNTGPAATPWPGLVLTLKNSTGMVTNRKIIEPLQYVLAEQLMQAFQAGTQIPINLPFILTGAEVSNYELGLFFP